MHTAQTNQTNTYLKTAIKLGIMWHGTNVAFEVRSEFVESPKLF